MRVKLEKSWLSVLNNEFDKPYMQSLQKILVQEEQNGITIYPQIDNIYKAFEITPFNNVKVVILGQDPYHGAGQAHGLSFSVQKGLAIPPSLKNIFKELVSDVSDFKTPPHGNLTYWAQQGVLMLNSTLTVRAKLPGSHQKAGWQNFTNEVITALSNQKKAMVFILWGKFAQAYKPLIDIKKHLVIQSAHPSPFSAHQGFLGSKPFSKTNNYLKINGLQEIDWQIT